MRRLLGLLLAVAASEAFVAPRYGAGSALRLRQQPLFSVSKYISIRSDPEPVRCCARSADGGDAPTHRAGLALCCCAAAGAALQGPSHGRRVQARGSAGRAAGSRARTRQGALSRPHVSAERLLACVAECPEQQQQQQRVTWRFGCGQNRGGVRLQAASAGDGGAAARP